MPEPDLLDLFARPLHGAGVRYLVAGSLGAMLYSEPRLTLDVDLAEIIECARQSLLFCLDQRRDLFRQSG